MGQERRKNNRYEIGNAVSIDPDGVYQIVDISERGFRFKCPPHTAVPESWVTDIINSVIHLERFPAKKIWVSIYENENNNLPFLMIVGAKFGRLKKDQKLKLIKLLQSMSLDQVFKNNNINS